MRFRSVLYASVFAATPVFAQNAAVIDANQITHQEALMLAQAALASCKEHGYAVNVQVVDADGRLRVALAADNAKLAGLTTTPKKVASVLAFRTSTRELQARLSSDPAFAGQFGKDPRYHFSPGGLPIYKADKLVAVIAVGGASQVDESCALDALKLLPWAKTRP